MKTRVVNFLEERRKTMENQGVGKIDEFLSALTIGEGKSHRNLTVFPVFSGYAKGNGYVLLKDAMESEKFTVTEVDEGGSVPNLKVINQLDEDVLILDGEELIGAKQNRIVNTTIIIGKKKEVIIPVSCVERGRWRYSRKNFAHSPHHLYSALRHKKLKSVSASLKTAASYRADQNEIWQDIEEKAKRLSVHSDTEAMNEIFENYEDEVKKYEQSFSPKPEQIGFIAMIDNKVVGCDIFGAKNVLPKVYRNLLKGYILDALEKNMERRQTASGVKENLNKKTNSFLVKLKKVKREKFKSVGEGDDIRLESKDVNGAALVHKERVVHMAAFKD